MPAQAIPPPPPSAQQQPSQPLFTLSPAAAEIETLIRARYPLIAILSWEEERVLANLLYVSERLGKNLYEWSASRGLLRHRASLSVKTEGKKGTRDPVIALREVLDMNEPAVVVLKDFHPYLKDSTVRRGLRDLAQALRQTYVSVIILSPTLEVPVDLEKDLTLLDFPVPGPIELAELIERIRQEIGEGSEFSIARDPEELDQLVRAAQGLTLYEAENVFAKALVSTGRLSANEVRHVFAEKRQIVRKAGLLEYVDLRESLVDVGGLESLKTWLTRSKVGFTEKAREFGVQPPRGVLFLGVQGCGKSLCAKATAALFEMPLLRLDIGAIFDSFVGESESQIRRALALAQNVSPCVLWIDEIDKALAGLRGGGSGDSGTTQRVFGTLVTWMQENDKPVFVVATANNIAVLPPEILRKGRFDEIFFVDLPDARSRADIFRIHIARRRRNPRDFDLPHLAQLTEGFSGAEIEAAVVAAMFIALCADRDLAMGDLIQAIRETYPLSKTMGEDIDRLRQWSTGRTRPAAGAAK